MAGLLYREFVLNRKNLLMIFGGELLISSIMFFPLFYLNDATSHIEGDEVVTAVSEYISSIIALLSVFVYIMLFLTIGIFTASFFEADETKKWTYFITSTPLTDVGQIKEKYLFTLLLYIALFVWCYFIAVLSAALGGGANVMVAFEMLCIMLVINAVEFPFLVRFGSKMGGHVKTAFFMVIMLVAFEYLFFGDLTVFGSPEKIYEFFLKLSDSGAMSDITLVLMAIFPYFAVGLYYLSYKISCKLYLKGAEEYER